MDIVRLVGINMEALEAIKLRVSTLSYKLIGALMFDKMVISTSTFRLCNDKIVDYVDCGNNIECDATAVAREALVFCVVCIKEGGSSNQNDKN